MICVDKDIMIIRFQHFDNLIFMAIEQSNIFCQGKAKALSDGA